MELIAQLKETPKKHANRTVQGHHLAQYFSKRWKEKVESQNRFDFGDCFRYNKVFLGEVENEFVTIEKYIPGIFSKYINNNCMECGICYLGMKAQCFVHLKLEKSDGKLMVVDLQGCGLYLGDPEIASSKGIIVNGEISFCAGYLNILAIENFKKSHKCNNYCELLGLTDFSIYTVPKVQ